MFLKNQYIFSETMGVCKVVNIRKLSSKKQYGDEILYYHLRSAIDKTTDAYIPVENHKVLLRELITKEEAEAFSEEELSKMNTERRDEVRFVIENDEKLQKIRKELEKELKKAENDSKNSY